MYCSLFLGKFDFVVSNRKVRCVRHYKGRRIPGVDVGRVGDEGSGRRKDGGPRTVTVPCGCNVQRFRGISTRALDRAADGFLTVKRLGDELSEPFHDAEESLVYRGFHRLSPGRPLNVTSHRASACQRKAKALLGSLGVLKAR